jgi:cyanophycin synthetase
MLLASLGYPAPVHTMLRSADEIPQAVEAVGFPCVTKPIDRGGGKGVSAGLKSIADVESGFAYARSFSPGPVMLEAFLEGDDHRLLVADGRFVAAIRRDRPWVVGDGRSTILELIEARNQGKSTISHVVSNYVDPIKLDEGVTIHLLNQGLSLDHVLPDGQKVTVRSNANLSTGGDCTDVTEAAHPHFRILVESLATTLNIGMGGFDYITPDISKSWKDGGGFVELNLTPGLDALIVAGWSPAAAGKLALGSGVGRIPIDLVVVPDAFAADTERYLETAVASPTQGWTSRRRAQLAGVPLDLRSTRHWSAVDTLLGHRALHSAAIVATDSEVVQYGLPIDRCARTWLCAVDLPEEWRAVVDRCSETVWTGDQAGFREAFAVALARPGGGAAAPRAARWIDSANSRRMA